MASIQIHVYFDPYFQGRFREYSIWVQCFRPTIDLTPPFCIRKTRKTNQHLAMIHDSPKAISKRDQSLKDLNTELAKIGEGNEGKRKKSLQTPVIAPEELKKLKKEMMQRSTCKEDLQRRFDDYLKKLPGKKKETLSEKTLKGYRLAIFGKSNSLEKALQKVHGPTSEIHDLMFGVDFKYKYIQIDSTLTDELLSPKNSPAKNRLLSSSLVHLCKYFMKAASYDYGYDNQKNDHLLKYFNFTGNMKEVVKDLKEQSTRFSHKASQKTSNRKQSKKWKNPHEMDEIKDAVIKYISTEHFKERIDGLAKLASKGEKGEDFDIKLLVEAGQWLANLICLLNGCRRQAPFLILNSHIPRKLRATREADSDKIVFDCEAPQSGDVTVIVISSCNEGEDGGKTGDILLSFPRLINDALVNYYTAKMAKMGPLKSHARLLINKDLEALPESSIYQWKVTKDLWKKLGRTTVQKMFWG
jgi:hypothetical protein